MARGHGKKGAHTARAMIGYEAVTLFKFVSNTHICIYLKQRGTVNVAANLTCSKASDP